jgi:hypothetical protein
MKKFLFLCTLLFVFFSVAVSQAEAISFTFNEDLSTDDVLGPGPFGTVTLSQNGSAVNFTVTLSNDLKFAVTGAGSGMNFLSNGIDVGLDDIVIGTGLEAYYSLTPPYVDNAKGPYNFGIVFSGQKNGASDPRTGPIEFTVLDSLISDFTNLNTNGYIFAADVYRAVPGTNGYTGLIAVGGTPSVPEPATMLLLGSGLLGLAFFGRKFKK